jgi:hypothetical protein
MILGSSGTDLPSVSIKMIGKFEANSVVVCEKELAYIIKNTRIKNIFIGE